MSPTPGRGNLRVSRNHLTRREQEALRPEVERLAALGLTYREIAKALSTPMRPLNGRKVRTIQYKYSIPAVTGSERTSTTAQGKTDSRGSNSERSAKMRAARAKIRPLIEVWVAERWTDAQMAAALNERGVPTLSECGEWTVSKVESLRRREGVRAVQSGSHRLQETKFVVPRHHEAHCNTCDAPIHFDWFGNAALHQRLTKMVVAGVRVVGQCEGSREPVIVRPLRRSLAVAA